MSWVSTSTAACAALLVLAFPGVAVAESASTPKAWPTSEVRYYINPVNSDVSPAAVTAAVQAGALTWSTQSDADFRFVYAGETSGAATTYNLKNEVIFRNAADGNAIATAYTWSLGDVIVDTDIIFWDGSRRYFTGVSGCHRGFYIEDIAAHEFGHAAGLGHTDTVGATMFATVRRCSTQGRSLASVDLRAIEALYPPSVATRPPAPPVQLTATPGGAAPASTVQLAWVDQASNEEMFVIERSSDGVAFSAVGQTPTDVTSYLDLPLMPETDYWYRVRATNAGGYRGASNPAVTRTEAGPAPPEAPTAPSPPHRAQQVSQTPVLHWAASPGAVSYDVYLGVTDPPPVHRRGVTTTGVPLTGLAPDTTYYWSVFANNEGGSSSASPWRFTTGGDPAERVDSDVGKDGVDVKHGSP